MICLVGVLFFGLALEVMVTLGRHGGEKSVQPVRLKLDDEVVWSTLSGSSIKVFTINSISNDGIHGKC